MSHLVKIECFDFSERTFKGQLFSFKKLQRYDRFDMRNKTLKVLRCV